MKAILHTKYVPADELQVREVCKPKVKDNEVFIQVCASTLIWHKGFTFVHPWGVEQFKNNLLMKN